MDTNEVMKKIEAHTWIKIGIVAMMLLCLLEMPYGFYTLARFLAMVGFGLLAYHAYGTGHNKMTITYGALAVLFQPFVKLTLGRDVWMGVDIAVAVFLIIVMVKNSRFASGES